LGSAERSDYAIARFKNEKALIGEKSAAIGYVSILTSVKIALA
jgi:hypothetical protein